MAIDDEFEKQDLARELANGAQKTAEEIIVHSQIVGLISWFLPPSLLAVGAAVNAGFTQLANKRFYARLEEMRNGMHARLQEVGESKVDKDWFQSEEFQTMLFEAARQVTATADRKKIAMLGNALANGSIAGFSTESRKELFLQIIRDLTPQHIAMLRRLLPDDSMSTEIRWRARSTLAEKDEDLAVLQMLAANGLVTEFLKEAHVPVPRLSSYRSPSTSESAHALKQIVKGLKVPPKRMFRLGEFGRDFLDFVSFSRIPE